MILIYDSRFFITCSSYFRLSLYTWGILLAYMRRRLSSRLRFHDFGKWGMTSPTENKVTQINLRDEANPKPIFISKGLSSFEKEYLL